LDFWQKEVGMKVVGIVGSPRKNGNTEMLTAHTLRAIAEEGLTTELIRLAGLDIRPCNACMVCREEERCSIEDDLFPIYLKMKEADGIILASPVYWFQISGMVVPGSTYWNVALGREKGEVQNDEEGMKTVWNFGKNVAWTVKKLKG